MRELIHLSIIQKSLRRIQLSELSESLSFLSLFCDALFHHQSMLGGIRGMLCNSYFKNKMWGVFLSFPGDECFVTCHWLGRCVKPPLSGQVSYPGNLEKT